MEELNFFIKRNIGVDKKFTRTSWTQELSTLTGLTIILEDESGVKCFDTKNNMGTLFARILNFKNQFIISRVTFYDQSDVVYKMIKDMNPEIIPILCDSSSLERGLILQSNFMINTEKKMTFREEKELFDILADSYFKLRHDFVVLGIFNILNLPFEKEKSLNNVFENIDKQLGRKTPDVVLRLGENNYQIIEVTVTSMPNSSKKLKEEKYANVLESIRGSYNCKFDVVSIQSNFGNLYPILHAIFPSLSLHVEIDKIQSMGSRISKIIRFVAPFFTKKIKPEIEDLNQGTLSNLLNFEFELSEEDKIKEQILMNSMNQPAFYNQVLDDLIDHEEIDDRNIPDFCKKQTPKHCSLMEIEELREKIPASVKENYTKLDYPAPSLHFVFHPNILKYPDIEKVSEEQLILDLLSKVAGTGFEITNPGFAFLKDIAINGSKIGNNQKTRNIFFTNYPDPQTKIDIENIKQKKQRQYLLLRADRIENRTGKKPFTHFETVSLEELASDQRLDDFFQNGVLIENKIIPKLTDNNLKPGELKAKRKNSIVKFSRYNYLRHILNEESEILKLCSYHKSMQLPKLSSGDSFNFFENVHIGKGKLDKHKKKLKKMENLLKPSESLFFTEKESIPVQRFMQEMAQGTPKINHIHFPDYLITSKFCPDDPKIMDLKQEIHKGTNKVILTMLQTHMAEYSYRSHLFAQQLIHLGSFSNRPKNLLLYNNGFREYLLHSYWY